MRCCVYTRFIYEIPYLESFLEHYLQLGFDKIFVLFHDIETYHLPEYLIEYVEIIYVENTGNKLINEYKHVFKDDYDWVLNVDSDEFLVLDNKYDDIQDFINHKLCTANKNINIFQFSWAWIHAFNPSINYTFRDILTKYKLYTGSLHDNSNDVWVKSMCKIKNIDYLTCHNCILNTQPVIYVNGDVLTNIENIYTDTTKINHYDNINLLPRKYVYNEETTYSETILVHVNTRNIMNAIIKGLNIHSTQVKTKRITKFKELKKFINNYDFNLDVSKNTVDVFTNCVGYKLKFPLQCLNNIEINIKKNFITDNKNIFCNAHYIAEHNRYHLDTLKTIMNASFYIIEINKFLKVLSIIGEKMDELFTV